MDAVKSLQGLIRIALAIVFLVGCAAPVTTPTLLPPPRELFKFMHTVQVTPDDLALDGGFIRLGYVPALDRIVAVFKSFKLAAGEGECIDGGHLYRIYTVDLQPEGESSVLNCGRGGGDSTELFVGNVLYDVRPLKGQMGWNITKYDAVTWKALAEIDYPLTDPQAQGLDEMIMLVNGMLDISSIYFPPAGSSASMSTHHNFFTPDLQFLGKRILADTPNIEGSSMIFVDGKYYFITANEIHGDVIRMTYDKDWKYLGMKLLRKKGIWSEGVAFDGQRFYVAYMDTSLNTGKEWVPLYSNIHLAAFDQNWNFVEDLAVTNYTVADDVEVWRPYLFLHGNRLYVSYDVTPHDPVTRKDVMSESQAYITVYELNGMP